MSNLKWGIVVAKNGEMTLKLNDVFLYSKYAPIVTAQKWLDNQIHTQYETYLLVGVGLGYHLEYLIKHTSAMICLYFLDEQERELFNQNYQIEPEHQYRVIYFTKETNISEMTAMKVIIHSSIIQAIGQKHSLYSKLESLKVLEVSYKKFSSQMQENFYKNVKLNDMALHKVKSKKIACLVSSGPSLDIDYQRLIEIQDEVDIYCVGSALKPLLNYGVVPKGIVFSDCENRNTVQLEGIDCLAVLYYLSTANHETILLHKGPKSILFQHGYKLAEDYAKKHNAMLVETGGSVATISFSLLESLNYEVVLLLGQDLGFKLGNSHAKSSTSNKSSNMTKYKIANYRGEILYTGPSYLIYLNWFEEKLKQTNIRVYNLSQEGAKIKGAEYIDAKKLQQILHKSL